MKSVMEDTQKDSPKAPGLCDWGGICGTMRVELQLSIVGMMGVS